MKNNNVLKHVVEYYKLVHTWCFANGEQGRYELEFCDINEAFERFNYLKLLIENDEYNFDAKFTPFVDGDMSFSCYENEDSFINRQDLVLIQREVEVSL